MSTIRGKFINAAMTRAENLVDYNVYNDFHKRI